MYFQVVQHLCKDPTTERRRREDEREGSSPRKFLKKWCKMVASGASFYESWGGAVR